RACRSALLGVRERGRRHVVGDDAEPLLDEVAEHRRAHRSRSDESHVHARSPCAGRMVSGMITAHVRDVKSRARSRPRSHRARRRLLGNERLGDDAAGDSRGGDAARRRRRTRAGGGRPAARGRARAALVAICSAPIMIAALAAVLLGERPTPRLALALVLAKGAVARMAPLPLAALTFAVAAALTVPALATPGAGRQLALGWPWLLYLGAVTTAGAYALYTAGLRHVPASAAGVASLLEPLTATLLGVILFGERLGVAGWAVAVLLLGALVLLVLAERR